MVIKLIKKGFKYRLYQSKIYATYCFIIGSILFTIVSLIFFIGFLKLKYFKYAIIIGAAYVIIMVILILIHLWNKKVYRESLKELEESQNGTNKEKMKQLEYLINKSKVKFKK